jgi:predicted 3-demethylubiquinone-9 3-methyltransferase (glyoxalase superfamily)
MDFLSKNISLSLTFIFEEMITMQKIIPHLWFDQEAEEAGEFYMSLFEGSKLKNKTILNNTPSGTVEMLTIELAGQEFMLLSGGPFFKFTPAVSFVIACRSAEEVERLWEKFMENGTALMPLGTYPFSEKFGWVMDQYGLSWQVMYIVDVEIMQKITPSLMFVGDQCGKAEEAIRFYASIFNHSKVGNIQRYGENDAPDQANTVQHADFTLENLAFAAMDSAYPHGFTFNEAISFIVSCDTQEEIDYFWEKLSAFPEAEQCGWLKDKFGFSWQITPAIMNDLMQDQDPYEIFQCQAP